MEEFEREKGRQKCCDHIISKMFGKRSFGHLIFMRRFTKLEELLGVGGPKLAYPRAHRQPLSGVTHRVDSAPLREMVEFHVTSGSDDDVAEGRSVQKESWTWTRGRAKTQ